MKTPQEILAILREQRLRAKAENEARAALEPADDLEFAAMNGADPNAPKSHSTGYPTTAAGGVSGINSNAVYGGMPVGNVVITAGTGLTMNGNVLNGSYVVSGGGGHRLNMKDKPTPTSPDLPDIVMEAYENERKVTMTLQPERSISAYEALQLTMLMMAYCEFPDDFCPLAFAKKHNLERHFKFS